MHQANAPVNTLHAIMSLICKERRCVCTENNQFKCSECSSNAFSILHWIAGALWIMCHNGFRPLCVWTLIKLVCVEGHWHVYSSRRPAVMNGCRTQGRTQLMSPGLSLPSCRTRLAHAVNLLSRCPFPLAVFHHSLKVRTFTFWYSCCSCKSRERKEERLGLIVSLMVHYHSCVMSLYS